MYNLQQVILGLKAGRSFERIMEGDGGKEYLTPTGENTFRHDVSGNAHGGWGGSYTMHIDMLKNGRWEEDGWKLTSS